jgi:hypothetical protein
MPAQVSETFVLRTYPFREADLIVSFFTRDQGKLRGVARRVRRPSAFGSGWNGFPKSGWPTSCVKTPSWPI